MRSVLKAWVLLGMVLVLSACAIRPTTHPTAPREEAAILVSDDTPAYVDVARRLAQHLQPPPAVYYLEGDAVAADRVAAAMVRDHRLVVAVGLLAAQAARRQGRGPVIFCQVFNYEDANLLTPWMKGVSATPPVASQFRAWKSLDPGLARIGVITGPGLRPLLAEARAAARRYRLRLFYAKVYSDKELFYAFKRMAPEIQGLWLVPDNRVLSVKVLRRVMAYGVQQGKQIVVFSPQLLPLGGVMSMGSVDRDVARRVLERVAQARRGDEVPGVPILPLLQVRVQVNAVAAKALGLPVPPGLTGGMHVY